MWKLSIEDDQGEKTLVSLTRDDYSIGRGEENAVRLTERNISRKHARLLRLETGWCLEDLNSYNGAYVNGQRVADRQPLNHGDLIQVGDYRLEVADESLVTSRSHPTVHDGVTMPVKRDTLINQPNRLVMVVGPSPGQEFPLGDAVVEIGRGEECQISINHASVSRSHAEIRPIGDGRYELIDKGSANGIRVNGVDLQRALLDARDNIELGDVVLKYVPKGQIYVPGPEGHEINDHDRGVSGAPSLPHPLSHLGGTAKLTILLGAAVVLVVVASLLALGGNSEGTELEEPAQASEESLALQEAQELAKKGDIEAAYEALGRIPAESPIRRGAPYRKILAQWAEHNFAEAERATLPKEKQRLLERVAHNVEVDRVRRQRAGGLLKALGGSAVAIDDLPEAVPSISKPTWTAPPAKVTPPPAAAARVPTPAAAPRAPVPAPTPNDTGPTLLRENPFGETKSPPTEPEPE